MENRKEMKDEKAWNQFNKAFAKGLCVLALGLILATLVGVVVGWETAAWIVLAWTGGTFYFVTNQLFKKEKNKNERV